MPTRGPYQFEVTDQGFLVDHDTNVEKVRALFRDDAAIDGNWGPGNPGDFDHGSWHVLCHLAGGSGVLETDRGRAWCGITHSAGDDRYVATVTFGDGPVSTLPLLNGAGADLASRARCLGFIEGSSLGHISARTANDPRGAFNGWPRQMFDQDVSSNADGGTVWEHWSTTRDIRPSSDIGSSVVRAYVTLVSRLGGRFIAAVARGRRQHSHPRQLVALVKAGLLTEAEATWETTPLPIPPAEQNLLYEATPSDALVAAKTLSFASDEQRYYMFQRRIREWSESAEVRRDLQ